MKTIKPGDDVYDYSWSRPSLARLRTWDCVIRYWSMSRTSGKVLTLAERDVILNAGVGLLVVWENGQFDPLQGATLGRVHGQTALQRKWEFGYPDGLPLLIANDYNVTAKDLPGLPKNLAQTDAYNRAFAKAYGYPVGIYGDNQIQEASQDYSVMGWLMLSSSFDTIVTHPWVHAKQRNTVTIDGGSYDPNTVYREFPAWSKTLPPPPIQNVPSKPPTQPVKVALSGDDEMQFIAKSPSNGSALVTVKYTADNQGSYLMSGIDDDDALAVLTIDAALPVVPWPDDLYLKRAADSRARFGVS